MRALVISNMQPDDAHPERGRFVRDQVSALRRLGGAEVELYEFPPGSGALARAWVDLRRRHRRPAGHDSWDVVHAHFGLSGWPALAAGARVRALTVHGSDLRVPRTRAATRLLLPRIDLLATASRPLLEELPSRSARVRAEVLPCGVDTERFRPIPRGEARSRLGLDAEEPLLLFPADPARGEKRHDRALALAQASNARLLTLGGVDPAAVPQWVNAVNAVVVPSEREGFGLAVLEALACDVPVLATPVGVHTEALAGVDGTLCAPFELARWREALAPHLRAGDARVSGRAAAERYSAARLAERVLDAWRRALLRCGSGSE